MMWLSWRQFRVPALVGLAALTGFAVYLVVLGTDIHDSYDAYRARCQGLGNCDQLMGQFRSEYENTLLFITAGFGLIPAVVGAFWGAPLVAREIETGTHRLVWNQSITRRRWLAVKLLVVGTAAAAVAGVASALLTWAAGPVDLVADHRFETVMFGARNVAPVAYAVFGFVLGTVVGSCCAAPYPRWP